MQRVVGALYLAPEESKACSNRNNMMLKENARTQRATIFQLSIIYCIIATSLLAALHRQLYSVYRLIYAAEVKNHACTLTLSQLYQYDDKLAKWKRH